MSLSNLHPKRLSWFACRVWPNSILVDFNKRHKCPLRFFFNLLTCPVGSKGNNGFKCLCTSTPQINNNYNSNVRQEGGTNLCLMLFMVMIFQGAM